MCNWEGTRPVAEVLSILHEKGMHAAVGIEVFNLDDCQFSPETVVQRAMWTSRSVPGLLCSELLLLSGGRMIRIPVAGARIKHG